MRATLVKIGNSHGVRLPKAVIEQAQLSQELDLQVRDGAVIIRSAVTTRHDWAGAAKALHAEGGDDLRDWDAVTADFAGDWS